MTRARVVNLIRVPEARRAEFLKAYEQIRLLVADGVPGHLDDQVCQSATDPEQWLITSEWADLADFEKWERSPEHRDLVAPVRDCFLQARSLRFRVHEENGAHEEDGVVDDLRPQRQDAAGPPWESYEDIRCRPLPGLRRSGRTSSEETDNGGERLHPRRTA